ncbi:hypothetical protein OG462_43640 [Streptomyces sp. NBC_01077]|uniref:hypothetical protein n=1 Tax=Streptomyces sp. NBC_01077 TaxID=2903746 RepID=UPI00386C476E|nr:hypothetical protein OG462_01365 [Streptomyces sp. NBC_01077]WSV44399.1 hypothetical protein OG462_43640 [Streptomyces sp. NBC_01077]
MSTIKGEASSSGCNPSAAIDYLARHTTEAKTKREIIRYVIREVHALMESMITCSRPN